MGRRVACFDVSNTLLAECLRMSKDAKIVTVEPKFQIDSVRIYVECPELPEVQEGEKIPLINPTITTKMETWNWNADKPLTDFVG
jgi:hypothetical protein